MTVNGTTFIDRLKEVFSIQDRKNKTKEPETKINKIAPERIRRSPGHQNLNELSDEPEWYHE